MDLIEKTVHETINNRNWDFYRDHYIDGSYTHDNLIRINNLWYSQIREQVFFHSGWIVELFNRLEGNFNVVELGCYRGELANLMINQFANIDLWDGYDICMCAIDESIRNKKYYPIHLKNEFWKTPIKEYDVFVSTHTLEHFTASEVFSILEYVEPKIKHAMYLEMPIKEKGKVWRGGASSHVLTWGRIHFRSFFKKRGWKILFERHQGMNWGVGVHR